MKILRIFTLACFLLLTLQSAFDKINNVIQNRDKLKSREEFEEYKKLLDQKEQEKLQEVVNQTNSNQNQNDNRFQNRGIDTENLSRFNKMSNMPNSQYHEQMGGRNRVDHGILNQQGYQKSWWQSSFFQLFLILGLFSTVYGFLCGKKINSVTIKNWYDQNQHYLRGEYRLVGLRDIHLALDDFNDEEESNKKALEMTKGFDDVESDFQ